MIIVIEKWKFIGIQKHKLEIILEKKYDTYRF